MSSETRPISSSQFALAIHDLPLDTLYSKAAEIQNSIAHLQRSNKQLQEYSDSINNDQSLAGEVKEQVGDRECLEAIRENEVVINRQKERVGLLREEVEARGEIWHMVSGDGIGGSALNGAGGPGGAGPRPRLTDDELRRQMAERMGDDEDDEGIHL
jgi:hypothetical protein